MKFRPLHDRVVIRRIEGEDQTKAHIIIPDTVKVTPHGARTIIAFGIGFLQMAMSDLTVATYALVSAETPPT